MYTLYKLIILIILTGSFAVAQNIEFEKSNFPDKKDQLKEVRKSLDDGKEAFELGKKEYDFILEGYVNKNRYYPVSRKDYQRAGDIYFKQAQPLLMKAQDFNPNNADLNYMLGVINFNLNPQSDAASKYFEKAFSLNGKIPADAAYLAGWAFQFQLKWDEAIRYYQLYLNLLNVDAKENAIAIEDVNKKIGECKVGKTEMANPQRIFVDNLGPNINTSYPEYSAFISADESMMVLTARRENSTGGKLDEGDNWPFEDLYQTFKVNGKWTSAQNFGPLVNSVEHDATAGLSGDGTTMFIFKYKEKDGGDIYQSNLVGNSWTKPEHLNKNINSKWHESSVSLSYDAKRLYFISDREGNLGAGDMYYSDKDLKGEWGPAVNVGPLLNTKYGEEGVFIHPDGKTIYFSSKGHKTMGGYDVFKSVFENGKWSEPINLGYPLNGPDDDVFFVISGSGNHGYFASSKQGGYGDKDIYRITFLGPEKAPVTMNEDNLLASVAAPVSEFKAEKIVSSGPKMTILKGVVSDAKTHQLLEAAIELIDNTLNEVIATFKSNSTTGKYLVSLPSGKNYGIAVKKDGYLFHSENFDLKSSEEFQEVEKNIDLKQIEVGQSIVLRNIFFDFDKATIRSESANELDRLIKLLTDNATLKIELGSHTDSKGSDDYNQKLSQSRSQSVVTYLIGKGISTDRLVAKGYGETMPVATNDTEVGRQENRRTEFKILSK
ncbi:MAG: OmpA family protein [Bacteroidetes bacterium]|jgi:outer membrane protein OmpA-like peptidoglycan-associated protein|nr:OmpA family protein [Bacteroidota bacterium]